MKRAYGTKFETYGRAVGSIHFVRMDLIHPISYNTTRRTIGSMHINGIDVFYNHMGRSYGTIDIVAADFNPLLTNQQAVQSSIERPIL